MGDVCWVRPSGAEPVREQPSLSARVHLLGLALGSPERMIEFESAKAVKISANRACRDTRVALVILRAGSSDSVAKPVALLGIDGMNLHSALEQRRDDGATRNFDPDHRRVLRAGQAMLRWRRLGSGEARRLPHRFRAQDPRRALLQAFWDRSNSGHMSTAGVRDAGALGSLPSR